MYLRQFKYLIAVVDEKHFGRAADRCNATQPSLSNGIKQLELELGTPIFLRGRGQRLHGLTEAGERIAKWARLIVAHCDAMRNEVEEMKGALSGDLRIGAMPFMSPVLPMLLQAVRARHPEIQVIVSFIGHEAMKIGLDTFSLDVAIGYMDNVSMGRRNILPLYTERFSLLVPDTEAFRDRDNISWAEAASLPLAMLKPSMHERSFVDQAFRNAGVSPKPKVEADSIVHLMFQVQFAELCTIIPSHFTRLPGLHPGTKALELAEPVLTREVALFWAEAECTMPMAEAMVSIVRQLNKTQELRRLLDDRNYEIPKTLSIAPIKPKPKRADHPHY
jgi:DNA-binding transcriptional LysR family regulator